MDGPSDEFRQQMLAMGIISYREHESLWSIARRCAGTMGVPMGGAGLVMGAGAGTVTIPGVGAVPGAVAGFLAGFVAGTVTCSGLNLSYRDELRKLLD